MKVLLIDVNCKKSSTGKIVYDIYSYLNKTEDEVAICYGRGEKINEERICKFGIDWETYLHALLTRVTGLTGCFSFFSTRKLLWFIKKYKPDIVHIHELHAYFVNIKKLINYLKKRGIWTVHTLHCEFSYTGKCGYADDCEKWKTECSECPKVKEYPESLILDWTKFMFKQKRDMFSDFDNFVITTPSEWVSERAKQSFLSKHSIFTIYNGIDTNIFYPLDASSLRVKHGIKNNQKIALSVAANIMDARKGGEYILEIARLHYNRDICFILIGVDSPLANIPENVIVLPKISEQDLLAQYYSLADVFLLCSKRETFSLTCAEALCCGTPVAGFKCGAPENIFAKPYAEFVEYGDVEQLEKVIAMQMNRNKEEVSKYGFENFSKEFMCNNYYMLYKSILGLM